MGEHKTMWRTLGYTALLGALIISLTNVGMSFSAGEGMKKTVALYGVYGVGVSPPLVVFSGKLRNFFSLKGGKKHKESALEFGEFLLADERPHIMYFGGAIVSVAMLLILSSFLYSHNTTSLFLLGVSVLMMVSIYMLSKNAISENSYLLTAFRILSMVFAIWWSFSIIMLFKTELEQTYPLQFWEKLVGIPSISMFLFAIILFLFSGIFWRIDAYLSEKNRGPLSAISIIFMGAGIASVFPPIWVIFSYITVELLLFSLFILNISVSILILAFLIKKGGEKIVITNRKIVFFRDFIVKDVKEYPYESVVSVGIREGLIGRKLGYGDVILTVRNGRRRKTFILHGIKSPLLIKNTILAMSSNREIKNECLRKPWTSGIPKNLVTHA